MSLPPVGIALYTFSPPGWTGTYAEADHLGFNDPTYPWYWKANHGSAVEDTYDFRGWAYTTEGTPSPSDFMWAPAGYAWKVTDLPHPVAGLIMRYKCNFSVEQLPTSDHVDIFSIVVDTGSGDSDPYRDGNIIGQLNLASTGKLAFSLPSWPASVNAISVNTTYALEVVMCNYPDNLTGLWNIYIDGDLWLSQDDVWYYWDNGYEPNDYVYCIAGYPEGQGPGITQQADFDVTLHMEDIVWTIERVGVNAHWTMMAPGIG